MEKTKEVTKIDIVKKFDSELTAQTKALKSLRRMVAVLTVIAVTSFAAAVAIGVFAYQTVQNIATEAGKMVDQITETYETLQEYNPFN